MMFIQGDDSTIRTAINIFNNQAGQMGLFNVFQARPSFPTDHVLSFASSQPVTLNEGITTAEVKCSHYSRRDSPPPSLSRLTKLIDI